MWVSLEPSIRHGALLPHRLRQEDNQPDHTRAKSLPDYAFKIPSTATILKSISHNVRVVFDLVSLHMYRQKSRIRGF